MTLFVLDALGLIYRSYHALSHVTLSSRMMFDTRAIYGFTLVLLSLVTDYARRNPVVVVFEGHKSPSEADFRTSMYPEYKATRPSAPAGVKDAVPWVKKIVRALGLSVLEVDRFEADDVIGTLVRKARDARLPSVIVSSDKDFRQLLDAEWVRILRPANKSRGGASFEYVTEHLFREEFCGLDPARYVDILALMGDNADNIPGVPGIGKKSAPELISSFGTLDALLHAVANPDGVPTPGITPRQARLVRDHAESARLSHSLVEIDSNVAIDGFDLSQIHRRPVHRQDIADLVECLDFDKQTFLHRMYNVGDGFGGDAAQSLGSSTRGTQRASSETSSFLSRATEQVADFSLDIAPLPGLDSLRPELNGPAVLPGDAPANLLQMGTHHVIRTHEQARVALAELEKDCLVSRALGIAHVAALSGEDLAGIAVCASANDIYYFDVCSFDQVVPSSLIGLLHNTAIEKRGWSMKQLCKQLSASWSVHLLGRLFDVRIACDLIHAGRNISNRSILRRYLGEEWIAQEIMQESSGPPFATAHDAESALKCCEVSFLLAERIEDELQNIGASRVANEIEFPLIPVLARMEIAGVPFDTNGLRAIQKRAHSQLETVRTEALALVPEAVDAINLASRGDVAKVLFEIWKIPIVSKTGGGKPSTGRSSLLRIAENNEVLASRRTFVRLLLKFRELLKIENTYTSSLVQAVTMAGRIHSTICQDASASGRLSMSRPNLQSIPARSELGREIRGTVAAENGFQIMCADYSQIELRILAALSGDETMIAAFQSGIDIHSFVAARIFSVADESQVSSTQRSRAKAVSYGIPYGISVYGLSRELGSSLEQAKRLMDDFHRAFPRIEEVTKTLIYSARDKGFAETLCGRRLYLPLLRHGATMERRAAERLAINMPIQGTQADMIKRAMIGISSRLHALRAKSRLILQVHDELVLEVADGEQAIVKQLTIDEMSHALPLPHGVEVEVKCGIGSSWKEAAARSIIDR
jgi:DNA polymerase I